MKTNGHGRLNSRAKGKRGELEFVGILKEHGLEARRGQQYEGSSDSPDVVCPDLPDYHMEIKRQNSLRVYPWFDKLSEEVAGKTLTPVLFFRKDNTEWLATFNAYEAIGMMIELTKLREENQRLGG